MGGGGFTHLHAVSGFSLRYGAGHAAQLAERAAERGMDALALTDRDTVAGAVRFAKACARAGVRPLFGAGLAVPEYGDGPARPGTPAVPGRETPVRGGAFVDESAPRAVFLARNGIGWAALCRMISAAHRGADTVGAARTGPGRPQPRLDRDDLTGDGLYALLGPDSEVGSALAAGRPDLAARLIAPWREIYGGALRLEAVCHHGHSAGPGSLRLAARTVGFAAQQGLTAVLSNAVRYPDPGRGEVADVLDAARRLTPVDARGPDRLDSGERWLKGAADMARIAERIAEAAGEGRVGAHRLLRATEETAAHCTVDPRDDLGIGRPHFPESALVMGGDRSADRVLYSRCAAGLVRIGRDRNARYWKRLEDELDAIRRLGFAAYFLTVGQVVDDVREMGVRVAARGSGTGSLVNHLLGITAADPLEHGLLMEGFLSVHRKELPDIDIDVESARRIEVCRRIFERFGARRVATVAMPETYRVRHAIRDVGAALGMDPVTVDRLAKSFPHIRAKDARTTLAELPELRAVTGEEHDRLWELVEAMDGLPRGVVMHPSGVLLSDATLLDRTPVVPAGGEGFPMSQFDKEDVEDLKLLKLDVLGGRTQSAMAYAVDEIERATGERLDLDDCTQVPRGDAATYELIRSAQTLGCFQIESPGQRDLVGRLRPATFHDLVVDISLFRPGPVAADVVRRFIEARHHRAPHRYPHADLKRVLGETYGVVVFHEQLIRIFDVMTGCGLAVADEQRRALSDPERQGAVMAWFGARARERGYTAGEIRRTWELLSASGSHGFCKAHAVAFAVPAYQSAWLKAHRPAAFYAGVLTHDPGLYPKRLLLADARRRGVPVLPPDVNRSDAPHRVESVSGKWGLRLGLADVHGIGAADTERLVVGQPYVSLRDFWRRARPGRPVAERLAQVGALDCFGGNRRDLLLQIAELHRRGRGKSAYEGLLPRGGDAERAVPAGLPGPSEGDRLGADLGAPGRDASRHLTQDHHSFLAELGAVSAKALRGVRHGQTVLVAGAKGAPRTPPIHSGRRVVLTTLDDGTGVVDCAFFDDSHEARAHTVFHSFLLLVRGTVQRRGPQSFSVVGAAAWNLAELLELRRTGGLEAVAERLAEPPEGAGAGVADGERAAIGRTLWRSSPGSAG